MAFFSNIGQQFSSLGKIIGEGARKTISGVQSGLSKLGAGVRQALPFLGGTLATGRNVFRAGVGEGLTPQQTRTAQQVVRGQVKTPQQLRATIPGLSQQKAQALFGLETGQLTPTQARQNLGLTTRPSTLISGGGGFRVQPTQPTQQRVSTPQFSPFLSSEQTAINIPAPPPPVARTGGFAGAPTTGFGVNQRVVGLSTAGQGAQFGQFQTEEERDRLEELKPSALEGFSVAEDPTLKASKLVPTTDRATEETGRGLQVAGFDEQGNMILPGVNVKPSTAIDQGKITIPNITDEQGVIDFAAQEASRQATLKMSQTGIVMTPQDFDNIFQVKKQQSLDTLRETNPELYNSITNPQAEVPTDESILETLDPSLQERGKSILDQTPSDFLDSLFEQTGMTQLIKDRNLIQANIMAEAEAYDSMISDIREDPDFPKKLGQRRMAQIEDIKRRSLTALQAQLGFITDQYNQQMNLVKLQLGIFQNQQEAERDRQNQELKNNKDQLNLMINSGAIAGLTDEQAEQWAQATGFTADSIRQIRDATTKREKVKLEGKPKAKKDEEPVISGVSEKIQELSDQNLTTEEIRATIKKEFKLTDSQAKALVEESGIGMEQFIDKDFFRAQFTRDQLIEAVKEAGFAKLFKTRDQEIEAYLDSIMSRVEALRKAGLSDEEILKQLT